MPHRTLMIYDESAQSSIISIVKTYLCTCTRERSFPFWENENETLLLGRINTEVILLNDLSKGQNDTEP